jgi:hypothetical protein
MSDCNHPNSTIEKDGREYCGFCGREIRLEKIENSLCNTIEMDGQRVLSVKNPWAYMIMFMGKDIENRTWHTNYRGRILIHASKKSIRVGDFIFGMLKNASYRDCILWHIRSDIYSGKIIGSIELVDCIQNSTSPWAQRGYWHWVLRNPRLFTTPLAT